MRTPKLAPRWQPAVRARRLPERAPERLPERAPKRARRAEDDGETHWGFRPRLKTVVDPARFRGACDRVVGWHGLGITRVRGLARPGAYRGTLRLISSNFSNGSGMPSRPAMAMRCTMAFVLPPSAISTAMAFSNERSLTMPDGLRSSHTFSMI